MSTPRNFYELYNRFINSLRHLIQSEAEQDQTINAVKQAAESLASQEKQAVAQLHQNERETLKASLDRADVLEKQWKKRLNAAQITVEDPSSSRTLSLDEMQAILAYTNAVTKIIEVHDRLFLTYTIYRLLQIGLGDGLIEIIRNKGVGINELGGTLHSRLKGNDDLTELFEELTTKLTPPFVTSWYPLPEIRTPIECHTDTVLDCAISADDTKVVSVSNDKKLLIWDVETGQPEGNPFLHNGIVNKCSITPNGLGIISASEDGIRMWDRITGEEYKPLSNFASKCCDVSPDGEKIIWGQKRTLKVWYERTNRFENLKEHKFEVLDCAWSPNGKFVIVTSADKTASIIDLSNDNKLLASFEHDGWIYCCAWTPDGNYVATGSADSTLKIWNCLTGQLKIQLYGHQAAIRGCSWSSDGTKLLSVSEDKSLKIWNVDTGECIANFYTTGKLFSCAISGDDRFIIVTGERGVYWLKLIL